jgi:hypothetical protein
MKKLASLIVATTLIAATTEAATITSSYSATSAVGSSSDHSLWISTCLGNGIGSDFDFDPAGLFNLLDDGTAALSGTVVSQSNNNAEFQLRRHIYLHAGF